MVENSLEVGGGLCHLDLACIQINTKQVVQKGRPVLSRVCRGKGRRDFGARSVQAVREHDKDPRTPLAAFFNNLLHNGGTWRPLNQLYFIAIWRIDENKSTAR